MRNIKAFTREERAKALKELGLPAFREKQIFAWICRGAKSWDECTDLSKDLRRQLAERFSWDNAAAELVQTSSDGTRKFLLRMPDGERVEAVFMAYEYGNSLCISTQVGCNMGCSFCASTIGGRIRSLESWEMLEEVVVCVRESGEPINHIVLMGMGEPFDNYEAVAGFLRTVHDPQGLGLSYRNITLSTCGLVPGIRRFGEEFPQVNLAISLHASNQQAREKLMPVAKAYPLPELMRACRDHAEKTGRRVTFGHAVPRQPHSAQSRYGDRHDRQQQKSGSAFPRHAGIHGHSGDGAAAARRRYRRCLRSAQEKSYFLKITYKSLSFAACPKVRGKL